MAEGFQSTGSPPTQCRAYFHFFKRHLAKTKGVPSSEVVQVPSHTSTELVCQRWLTWIWIWFDWLVDRL